ncbi:alpha-glucuronidase family glycosyl hydrolase [Gilvimarinus algae]|uniref:Xylan alpha-1,2-glucuronidase n=1 Tax=Gilvimarinus algae TaxID=3058037 RepID=A0ABT8TEZ0_9GAMM|nr:alpha-glucuronidase family glycosyl hydrolase [Gilvimarinus sp. SDUM040014]MDO3381236.1 alpha-glucuronidase family glycosyl hydrolase [Gilvimarinus sp. SDUM040014]
MFRYLALIIALLFSTITSAEDGYRMWLRYDQVADSERLAQYRKHFTQLVVAGDSATLELAAAELTRGIEGLTGRPVARADKASRAGALIVGTPNTSSTIAALKMSKLTSLGQEGYLISSRRVNGKPATVIAANTEVGALYGAFALLRQLQTHADISNLELHSAPSVKHRVVNHWDNLNRLVERGYAGLSLWDWGTLPAYKDNPRYHDYARINASLGINGTVINNVNADARILTDQFLEKAAALADVFRPYGIKLYLSVKFNSPMLLDGFETADPLDPDVQKWWQERTKKVYDYIPDFGGFLVKANSEGQPGPQDFGRNHAEGANMLAEALEPFGGVVFWRAFVYAPEQGDRFREAYDEFMPLDGQFKDNVIVQIKNGPIDFQPREPFSPLFGSLKKTNIALELQVTQEYFGFSYHLAYQGPLFAEALNADTYAKGEGSTIGKILAGDIFEYQQTGMAAVINPGTDRNWTGHPFVQSSWYAFGRMAWDYRLGSETIADEWLRMTFSNDPALLQPLHEIMSISREAGVNYRSPLGLTHLYAQGHHYGPAPWHDKSGRPDWTAYYYHQATKDGIGFDRTQSGSNAIEQYHEPLTQRFANPDTTPEDLLLWFHHLSWRYEMDSGRSLWHELVHKYDTGVAQVQQMQNLWDSAKDYVDTERFEHVKALLKIQERDAIHWRDACISYFQSVNGLSLPKGSPKPAHELEYYKRMEKELYIPDPWYPVPGGH